MDQDELQRLRRERLTDLINKRFGGVAVALGRRMGYDDPGYAGQLKRGVRPINEKTVAAIEAACNVPGWFDLPKGQDMPRAEAPWPHQLVSQEDWERLTDRQRGAVEMLMRLEITKMLEEQASTKAASRKRAS